MHRTNSIGIYFSRSEYERVEKALAYTILDWTPLAKVLLKKGLDAFEQKNNLTFVFNKNKKVDKTKYKTKVVRLDEQGYQKMVRLCECTPFSMSTLAKYLIMPQLDEIIEKKGFDFKL